MFVLLIGCLHKGIPMPGPTAHLRERIESVSASEQPIISEDSLGIQISEFALAGMGQTSLILDGKPMRYDCSGFVLSVYGQAGIDISGNTSHLHNLAKQQNALTKTPSVGDVVFFDNTYDRNKNGKLDDNLTHIAIVVQVDPDKTVHMVHLGGKGITKLYLNLAFPNQHTSPNGKIWNSFLRQNKPQEKSPRLAGELWNVYGNLWSI